MLSDPAAEQQLHRTISQSRYVTHRARVGSRLGGADGPIVQLTRPARRSARAFTTRFRRGTFIWPALVLTLATGILLGLFVPRPTTTIEFGSKSLLDQSDAHSEPQFVASEYHETFTTLWLRSTGDPTDRGVRIVDIPHARGWDIEAAVAPGSDEIVVLALPPDGLDPARHASLLLIDIPRQTDKNNSPPVTELATGLDLRAGVVWSDDAHHLLVRRDGFIEALNAKDGRAVGAWAAGNPDSAQPIAMQSNTVWLAQFERGASVVTQLRLGENGLTPKSHIRISSSPTRDWALSPDGTQIAFTEQDGADLRVRVIPLTNDGVRFVSSHWAYANHRGSFLASASPVWRADGTLDVGTWLDSSGSDNLTDQIAGFTLPLAWDKSEQWLALRSLSGSGPRAVTEERLALRGPNGEHVEVAAGIKFVGWWTA